MLRTVFVVLLLTGAVVPSAFAAQKSATGSANVSCSCTCSLGQASTTKQWSLAGTRADCQAFSGATCKWDTASGNQTITGQLSGCDAVVEISKPADQPIAKLPGTNAKP